METNNDKSKKFSQEAPVIRQTLYVKAMQVSVSTRKNNKTYNEIFRKIDLNVIRSITFTINEHHGKINRQMLSLLTHNSSA